MENHIQSQTKIKMPRFSYVYEKKMFMKFFRLSLQGDTSCTIWDYLVQMYRFQYLEVFALCLLEVGIFICLLFMAGTTVPLTAFNINLIIFTCALAMIFAGCVRVQNTRKAIMAFWAEKKKEEQKKEEDLKSYKDLSKGVVG